MSKTTKTTKEPTGATNQPSSDKNKNDKPSSSGAVFVDGASDLSELAESASSDLKAVSTSNDTMQTPSHAPSTVKGSGKNALSHGVYSRDIVLPWESADEFESLHASFKDEWKPNGCAEEQAVLQLTECTWTGWRAAKMALLEFHRAPYGTKIGASETVNWQDILNHEAQLPDAAVSAFRNANEVLEGLIKLVENVGATAHLTNTAKDKDMQMAFTLLRSQVSQTIDVFKQAVPSIKDIAKVWTLQSTMFEKAYDPETIERQVRVMTTIDARIDKILRRLTSLKEYKRMLPSETKPPRLIESPSVAPTGVVPTQSSVRSEISHADMANATTADQSAADQSAESKAG